jgi:uncharacterized protein
MPDSNRIPRNATRSLEQTPQGKPGAVRAAAVPVIDTAEFARTGTILQGEAPAAGFERLGSMLFDTEGLIDWRAEGIRRVRAEGGHEDELHLQLSARLGVACSRCLGRLALALQASRRYLIAPDEKSAERLDAVEQDRDVLAASARMDLAELIEDEAIMMLPLVPRHERCDMPLALQKAQPDASTGQAGAGSEATSQPDAGETRPNPFGVLAALKRPR